MILGHHVPTSRKLHSLRTGREHIPYMQVKMTSVMYRLQPEAAFIVLWSHSVWRMEGLIAMTLFSLHYVCELCTINAVAEYV